MRRFPGFDKRIAEVIKSSYGEGRGAKSEFARSLGIPPQTVNMWFYSKDPRYPNEEVLAKISEKYGVSREYLLFGTGAQIEEHEALDAQIKDLIRMMDQQTKQLDRQLHIIDRLTAAIDHIIRDIERR